MKCIICRFFNNNTKKCLPTYIKQKYLNFSAHKVALYDAWSNIGTLLKHCIFTILFYTTWSLHSYSKFVVMLYVRSILVSMLCNLTVGRVGPCLFLILSPKLSSLRKYPCTRNCCMCIRMVFVVILYRTRQRNFHKMRAQQSFQHKCLLSGFLMCSLHNVASFFLPLRV